MRGPRSEIKASVGLSITASVLAFLDVQFEVQGLFSFLFCLSCSRHGNDRQVHGPRNQRPGHGHNVPH
jgi:hypothetical protein